MANYRRGRINDALAQELSIALRQVRDPGVANNFVSITRAEVAADLKIAKVYFSVHGDGGHSVAVCRRNRKLLPFSVLHEGRFRRNTVAFAFSAQNSRHLVIGLQHIRFSVVLAVISPYGINSLAVLFKNNLLYSSSIDFDVN